MPLLFDMPLEQLHDYPGRNPQPADFDAFWDRALAELEFLDPQVALIPADFTSSSADCYHLYFNGVGGARVHAKLLRPKSGPPPPPDVGGVKGNTLQGHIIRGLDGPPEKMLYRQIFLDAAQLARIVMEMPDVDENRVGAMGGSQGGGLTLVCAALEPRIKQAASLYPFLCDYRRIWEIDLATDAYAELQDYFRLFDPMHEREAAVFEQLGYIDVQHLSPRITAEVMMGTCLMDTVCPPSTQFAAYNKIPSPKSLRIYPDYGHETPPGYEDQVFQFMAGL
jgi:cephalosporin-C deacetylase